MLKELIDFFEQPGINKSGICRQAGISQQYLNRVLSSEQPLTKSLIQKLVPVMQKYGFVADLKYNFT